MDPEGSNAVIGALAEVSPGLATSNHLLEEDRLFAELRGLKLPETITDTGTAQRDDAVAVLGRGSAAIVGYVRAAGVEESINWGDKSVRLDNVFIIDARPTLLAEPSDPGAAVVNERGQIVGMVVHGEIRAQQLADHYVGSLRGRKLPDLSPAFGRLIKSREEFLDSWLVEVPIHRIYAIPIRPVLREFEVVLVQ